MVNGIDIFREHFNHFKEQYTVIGGFACDLLMNDAGLDFRQTVDIDMVLIMTVNPGFGGQSFIPGTIAKLHELKAMCERHGVSPLIEVDGGISSKNIAEVVKAGANVLVAGSAVFKSEDPAAEVALLQKLGNEAAQEA